MFPVAGLYDEKEPQLFFDFQDGNKSCDCLCSYQEQSLSSQEFLLPASV